jgi:hypothetical protein
MNEHRIEFLELKTINLNADKSAIKYHLYSSEIKYIITFEYSKCNLDLLKLRLSLWINYSFYYLHFIEYIFYS